LKVNYENIVDFSALQIKIASPEDIVSWSHGEVKNQKQSTIVPQTRKRWSF
jgi:DNA-directed RNA polymerase beta' subunit